MAKRQRAVLDYFLLGGGGGGEVNIAITGFKVGVTCPECKGSGVEVIDRFETFSVEQDCWLCDGVGYLGIRKALWWYVWCPLEAWLVGVWRGC